MSRFETDFGRHLTAKQKLKFFYGRITEKQFRGIFAEAKRLRGDSGENFVGLLERRLDAIIHRSGLVKSIFTARQIVSHKHVTVNGKIVNIPSYRVKVGDIIKVSDAMLKSAVILEALESKTAPPAYLQLDSKAGQITFNFQPKLADIPYPIIMELNPIVEFYSH